MYIILKSGIFGFFPPNLCNSTKQLAIFSKLPFSANFRPADLAICLQSADIVSTLQTGCWKIGRPNLAIFCPIFGRDVSRWDNVPPANILPNLHTGQNVPRCAIPSPDGTKCWQMVRTICRRDSKPDGPEHKHYLPHY